MANPNQAEEAMDVDPPEVEAMEAGTRNSVPAAASSAASTVPVVQARVPNDNSIQLRSRVIRRAVRTVVGRRVINLNNPPVTTNAVPNAFVAANPVANPAGPTDADVIPETFTARLLAYSLVMMPENSKQNVENGGKVILPPSFLATLSLMDITYPLLFKITNPALDRSSHCGVLEFTSHEGICYLPHWMMKNLLLGEGEPLTFEDASLPVATYAKFKPQSVDFLDVPDPKSMLENALRHYACLTTGDTVAIHYYDKMFELKVMETLPAPAVCCIDCDINVDFDPPVGYVEPVRKPREVTEPVTCSYAPVPDNNPGAFSGAGHRLDGQDSGEPEVHRVSNLKRGVPDFEYKPCALGFARDFSYFDDQNGHVSTEAEAESTFQAFVGQGETLQPQEIRVEE